MANNRPLPLRNLSLVSCKPVSYLGCVFQNNIPTHDLHFSSADPVDLQLSVAERLT